jgi:hypothetical protein
MNKSVLGISHKQSAGGAGGLSRISADCQRSGSRVGCQALVQIANAWVLGFGRVARRPPPANRVGFLVLERDEATVTGDT